MLGWWVELWQGFFVAPGKTWVGCLEGHGRGGRTCVHGGWVAEYRNGSIKDGVDKEGLQNPKSRVVKGEGLKKRRPVALHGQMLSRDVHPFVSGWRSCDAGQLSPATRHSSACQMRCESVAVWVNLAETCSPALPGVRRAQPQACLSRALLLPLPPSWHVGSRVPKP